MGSLATLLALVSLGTALAAPALAGVAVFPDQGCPASAAIATSLASLGALRPLEQLGSAEVRLDETRMQIVFRDRDGEHLGWRVVAAGSDCGARASLAAAVIAAFVGTWSETKLADAPRPSRPGRNSEPEVEPSPPPSSGHPVESVAKVASPPSPSAALGLELGVAGLGLHDGNAAALGGGGRLDLTLGSWSVTGLVEASTERTRGLGSGAGAYASRRGGIGLGFRQQGRSLFWDLSLVLMLEHLSLSGRDVDANRTASAWDFLMDGDLRLGWRGRRWRPFLLLGASYSVPPQRMALRDSDLKATVSAFNARIGLGMSFVMAP